MRQLMRSALAGAVIIGLLGVAGCSPSRTQRLEQTAGAVQRSPETAMSSSAPPGFSVEARTEFTGGPSARDTVRGTARLLLPKTHARKRTMRILVRVAGLSPGVHGWDIAHGTCVNRGAPITVPFTTVHGMKGVAAPLDANRTGFALGSAAIPRTLLSVAMVRRGRYSLRVFAHNGARTGGVQACATL